jgi:hypothetical protein
LEIIVMGTAIERVKAFRDMQASIGATEHRMPHTTSEAIAVASELDLATLRHAERVISAVSALAELNKQPLPVDDEPALRDLLNSRERARADFWDGFQGEVIEGVEIVRRGKL